jgi:hypothetical protein
MPLPLTESNVFALTLPMGPSGLIFSGDDPPIIKSVKPASPLSGIIDPGFYVIGMNIPDQSSRSITKKEDSTKRGKGETLTQLSSKELQLALRDSAKRAMRTLWFSKKKDVALSKSLLSNVSSLRERKKTFCSSFATSSTKSLVFLPPGETGLQLLGSPPLISSIEETSPLTGVLAPSEVYVLGLYSPKQCEHFREFDSEQLAALLKSTSREKGRILITTSDPNELPIRGQVRSDQSLNLRDIGERADSGNFHDSVGTKFWNSSILPQTNSETNVVTSQGAEPSSTISGDMPPVDEDNLVEIESNDGSMTRDVGASIPVHVSHTDQNIKETTLSPQHMLIRKTCVSKGPSFFSVTRPYWILSFHGKSMDLEMIQKVQQGLKYLKGLPEIQPQANGDYFTMTSRSLNSSSRKSPLDLEYETVLVALLDTLASMGWTLSSTVAVGTTERFYLQKYL